MNEYERKALLERIERESATVGSAIPESVEIQGDRVELRSFVFEVRNRDSVPPGVRDRVAEAKRNLRRERRERKQRLQSAPIDRPEAERIVEVIIGIDRALNALETLESTDIEAEAQRAEKADRERWMKFLRQVLGRDDAGHRPRQ